MKLNLMFPHLNFWLKTLLTSLYKNSFYFVVVLLTNLLFYIQAATADSQIDLGLIVPLTGERSISGQDALRAAELALEQLEQGREIPPSSIRLTVEDSQSIPRYGIAAYKRLRLKQISFILTMNSNVSLSISPLANADQVLQLAFIATSPRYSSPHDFTFRTNGTSVSEAEVLAQQISKLRKDQAGNIALVVMEDEYSKTLAISLQKRLVQLDLKPKVVNNYLAEELNFRSIIQNLKKHRIDYVVILGFQNQVAYFLKQQLEHGLQPKQIISSSPALHPDLVKIAEAAANDLIFSYPDFDLTHPAAKEFNKRYGHEMDVVAANAYDAVILAAEAVKRCNFKKNVLCLKENLAAIRSLQGIRGTLSFDDVYGDMQDHYVMWTVKDGHFRRQE